MMNVTLTVEELGGRRTRSFQVNRMYNLGSATREPDTARAHHDEVAKAGIQIALHVPAPRIYPIARHELVTGGEVFAHSNGTSGEVEIVLLQANRLYVGVGSDHTDRLLERQSIVWSKQVCPNVLAPVVWPFDEVREHWDACLLRSRVDGLLYQEVSVAAFLHPDDVLEILSERVAALPERDFLVFCGTVVSVDKALGFGETWEFEIEDPKHRRRIAHGYRVVDMIAEIKEGFRVPVGGPATKG